MNRGARITTIVVSGAVLGMLALTFAAEPLYSTFCRVTGFGGTTRVATKAPTRVIDRQVRVRFDANVDPGVPLKFVPAQPYMDVRLGETVLAFYDVTNTSAEPIPALATYNVAPHKTGPYFNKLECFCFKEKTFPPGVTERLPVVFYVAPELDNDLQDKDVSSITLSYTYYRTDAAHNAARLEDASAVN